MARHFDGVFQRKDRKGFWISLTDERGRRKKQKTHAQRRTEAKAIRAIEQAKIERAKSLGIGTAREMPFAEFAEEFKRWRKGMLKNPKTYRREVDLINQHLLPAFPYNLGSIRRKDVDLYVSRRGKEGASAATVHKELVVLKNMLKQAVIWEYILFSPADLAKSPSPPPPRVRYLRRNELHDILNAAPPWLRPVVALAVATGMRRSEILGIEFRDIDYEHRMVILRNTKNGTMRFVPLNLSAWTVIESVVAGRKVEPTDKVFSGLTPDQVSMRFRRLCAHLHIEDFHFHDLRHTAASWLRMQGVDTHTVARLLGHGDMRTAARYQHLSDPYLRKSVLALDEVILGSGPLEWEEAEKLPLCPHSVPAGKEEEEKVAKSLNKNGSANGI